MRRRRRYHEPEDLGPEQDARDAAVAGRRYHVYVLDTRYGHYVGHTARLRARVREHEAGEVASTAGGNPVLAWNSAPMRKRDDAARFEAALKSWRDQRAPRFREITKLAPIPFARSRAATLRRSARRAPYRPRRYSRARGGWLGRFLRRELRGVFSSRRKRRMWLAIAFAGAVLGTYVANGGF